MEQLERIIEGMLFASDAPLSINQIANLFLEKERPEKSIIKNAITNIQNNFSERGIELVELASGYQFQVKTDLATWVQRLWEERPQKYSRAFLETLALIAYRQPITRSEIADIRGVIVNTLTIKTLLEREWIYVAGTKDVPGKPSLYATTKQFLDDFSLKSLEQLPSLAEVKLPEVAAQTEAHKKEITPPKEQEEHSL